MSANRLARKASRSCLTLPGWPASSSAVRSGSSSSSISVVCPDDWRSIHAWTSVPIRAAGPGQGPDRAPVEALGTPTVVHDPADRHGGRDPDLVARRRLPFQEMPGQRSPIRREVLEPGSLRRIKGSEGACPDLASRGGFEGGSSPSLREQGVRLVRPDRPGPRPDETLAEPREWVLLPLLALDVDVGLLGPPSPRHELAEEPADRLRVDVLPVPDGGGQEQAALRPGEGDIRGAALLEHLLVPERVDEAVHNPLEPGEEISVATELDVEGASLPHGVLLDPRLGE